LKKITLILSLNFLLFNLFGCGVKSEDSSDKVIEVIEVSKEVNSITVTGNGLAIYSDIEKRLIDRKIVLEQSKEIEVILKAIENSTLHSGPMSDEGENFNLNFTYKDGTSETIHLWLYPDRNSGRIQKENYEGTIQLLSKEDVQNIAKLLAEKLS
jgi:hypothetical protein